MFNKLQIEKPTAASYQEWRRWEEESKAKYPIRYFITETVPKYLSNMKRTIVSPFVNLKKFFYNRFVEIHHIIKMDLKPGWHEYDEKMLYANFQILVDYVELDCASHAVDSTTPSFWNRIFKGRNAWRSRELGLKYLAPHSLEEDPTCADEITKNNQVRKELMDLYIWWKDVRPNRVDPYESLRWKAVHGSHEGENIWDWMEPGDIEAKAKLRQAAQESWNLEEAYRREDQERLEKLVKLREWLWL